jgi:tetratricopeptide (TPR) repeat protein
VDCDIAMSAGLAPNLEWRDSPERGSRLPHKRELLHLAIQQRPDSGLLHRQLGDVLLRSGAHEDAAHAFTRALELAPGNAEAAFGLGSALTELNRIDEAIARFREADAVRPGHAETHVRWGRALAKAGRNDEALAGLRVALQLNPAHFQALHTLTRLLINRNDHAGICAECDISLERAPGNAAALALKSQALLALGELEAARALLDVDRFVRIVHPEPPPSRQGSESFLAALERSIRANSGHEFEPESRTARGGSRADLQPAANQPEAILRDMVQALMQDYRRSLLADMSHPFCAGAPNRACLAMWANILSEGGYHTPHIHPAAWVSGVYYVKVPGGGAEKSGVLELACTEPLFAGHANPLMRPVPAQAGMLVLFPSYFYHRTIPTRSREERISVAFDMVAEP